MEKTRKDSLALARLETKVDSIKEDITDIKCSQGKLTDELKSHMFDYTKRMGNMETTVRSHLEGHKEVYIKMGLVISMVAILAGSLTTIVVRIIGG